MAKQGVMDMTLVCLHIPYLRKVSVTVVLFSKYPVTVNLREKLKRELSFEIDQGLTERSRMTPALSLSVLIRVVNASMKAL